MKKKSFLITLAYFAILLTVVAFRYLVMTPVVVSGNSMFPTLKDSQRGFSLKTYDEIERFDIVVVDISEFKDTPEYYIVKRVIGLPGETVSCKDNVIYINGVQIYEPFLNEDSVTADFEITLGPDEYWCMGDNRSHSLDSRTYGAFSAEQIYSKNFYKSPF